jgi:glycosyltransferase involved in cell wall biosynthesis
MTDLVQNAAPPLFIDITRLLGRCLKGRLPTGVDRVGLAYVEHFFCRSNALVRIGGRAFVVQRGASQRLFEALLVASANSRRALLRELGRASFRLCSERELHGAFLFNTGHSGLELASYVAQLRRQQARPLFVLHDLIPLTHPEYCRAGERARHAARIGNMLAVASGVIANSRSTLDQLDLYARANGLPMPPAVAAPLAAAALPAPMARRPIEAPYFVMLSTIEPRKNHSMLLQVWRALVERMGNAAPRLVVIGQRGWECENAIDLLERCEALGGVVTELGSCSDGQLATYLHHAQALLFPSFAEGYGMPLAEALAARVPAIVSDLPAFREIAGAIPDYLDPLDGLGWMALIEAYCGPHTPARTAQLERIAGFAVPTWRGHFEQVEQLMATLV